MSRNWSWKKIGLQKSWNQARKNLVPKNSWNWYKNLGIGLVQISGSLYTLTVSGGDCYLPSLMVWCWWSLFGCVKLSVWWISSSSCSKMMITSIYSDEDIECETFSSKYGDATLSKKISAPSLQRFVKENICLEAGKANPSFSANFWIPNICRFSVHLKHFWRPTKVHIAHKPSKCLQNYSLGDILSYKPSLHRMIVPQSSDQAMLRNTFHTSENSSRIFKGFTGSDVYYWI